MDMSVNKLHSVYPPAPVQPPAVSNPLPGTSTGRVQPILATEQAPPSREHLEQAVNEIREFVQSSQRQLDFSIDDSTQRVVVKVIATDSGEVIRQIPSEAALKLAQSLNEAGSLLFDGKA